MNNMEEAKQRQRGELFSWCLIANIVDEHEVGQDHHIEHGTKIFSPGTKVYVSSIWSDSSFDHGGVLRVIGKPRKQWRLAIVYIRRDRLTNFRVRKVFDPKALRCMARDEGQDRPRPGRFSIWWGKDEEARKRVEEQAAYYNQDIYSVRQRERPPDKTDSAKKRGPKTGRASKPTSNNPTPTHQNRKSPLNPV